jgi:formiminotetrahydrofolate cyclodeaminase
LVVMGVEVTLRGAEAAKATLLDSLLREGRDILERQSAHADRDLKVFDAFMRARSLPQGSDIEEAVRREKMQRALIAATEVPLAAGRDIVAAVDLSRRVIEICKRQVVGDVAAGADLLAGSFTGMLRSVDANLPGIADGPLRARLEEERATVIEAAARSVSAAQAALDARRQKA